MTDLLDTRCIRIVDFFSKDGKHLKTTALGPNDVVLYEEGPTSAKDVVFISNAWDRMVSRQPEKA